MKQDILHIEFDKAAEDELFEALKKDHISGITFSGGDPLHPFNTEEVLRLAKKVKDTLPNKTVWLYTGFLWEEIKDKIDLTNIDVLVDGEFKKELNDNNLHWVGSSNQRIIDVQKSLKENKIIMHAIPQFYLFLTIFLGMQRVGLQLQKEMLIYQ